MWSGLLGVPASAERSGSTLRSRISIARSLVGSSSTTLPASSGILSAMHCKRFINWVVCCDGLRHTNIYQQALALRISSHRAGC